MTELPLPLLIAVAPTGAHKSKADHEALPMEPREIAVTAARCRLAGAGLLHLHVRDERGEHSLSPARYREALQAVRTVAGRELLVQISTEACGRYSLDQQMATVRNLKVDAASYALREFFAGEVVDPRVVEFFAWVTGLGVGGQFTLYTPAEQARLQGLVARRVLPVSRPHALFVLPRHGASQQSDPGELHAFLQGWPTDWPWSVCADGPSELAVADLAIRLGGHVRVGFEHNLYEVDGSLLDNNETRVRQVAELAARAGRPLATPSQVQALFAAPDAATPHGQ